MKKYPLIKKPVPREPYEKSHDLERIGLFISVVPEGQAAAITELLTKENTAFTFVTHGRGTASKDIYAVLGLGENHKQIIFSIIPTRNYPEIKLKLTRRFLVSEYTKGISVLIDIDSLTSVLSYRMITDRRIDETKKGKKAMPTETNDEKDEYEVIMVIVNDGYSDLVMDAAKKAGAKGGTILSARGTGNKDMEKFFGIVITAEKEIVMIIVPKEIKDDVLGAISKECGITTKGQGIAFSLKASDVTGIVENESRENN